MRLGVVLIFLLLCGSASVNYAAEQVSQTVSQNETVDPGFCIIRPDQPASAEIFADWQGRRFYFCCQSCRQDFLSDPSRFDGLASEASSQPGELTSWNDSPAPYANSLWGRVGRAVLWMSDGLNWIQVKLRLNNPISIGLSTVFAAWILLLLYCWRPSRIKNTGWSPKPLTAALITLLAVPCYKADSLRIALQAKTAEHSEAETKRAALELKRIESADRDLIHYATFHNHGNPPIPRPSKQQASLQKTYYRGNDERSSEQVNGGNYRTVTFKLWIEDESGQTIEVGSSVRNQDGSPKSLQLIVQFVRAPDTSSGYFTDAYMQRMYLTMQAGEFLGRHEPVPDRVSWRMIEHERVWKAQFTLPTGVIVREETDFGVAKQYVRKEDPARPYHRSGIVYLCEDRYNGPKMIGGRFHYAVQYDLVCQDGIVLPESDLWMQATYRGRNFAELQIEDDEWLSSEPIPEK